MVRIMGHCEERFAMRVFVLLLLPVAMALSGCGAASLAVGVVDAAAGVAGIAVDAAAATADVVTSPIR